MDYCYLLLEVADKVATVTLHRPDKGNALSPEVLEEVGALFSDIGARDDVNVAVLTGGERYFSAGFDLNEIRKLEKVSNEAYTALFHRAYRAILFCEQEWLFRSYIGAQDNHQRIDALQAQLAAARKK
jgi:enoyl-CoA hydratase/carnithine racemase